MDSEYIEKVLNGDTRAYRFLIEKYRDMAYSLAMSIVKAGPVAEEVTQDAFLKAYQSLGKFEQRSKFSTWLYMIVKNECLKKLRKKELGFVEDITELNDISFSEINLAVGNLVEEERKHYINAVLDQMIPNDSLILRLFYLTEQSMKEIGKITGFSDSKIKSILHRARKRFYVLLSKKLESEVKSIAG